MSLETPDGEVIPPSQGYRKKVKGELTESLIRDLAHHLAQAVFQSGDEPHDKVQRIAFKGGTYPDRETELGGYNQIALADHLQGSIKAYFQQEPGGTEQERNAGE